MPDNLTRRNLYDSAIATIDRLASTLNAKTKVCECCGLTLYDDRAEFQEHLSLTALKAKLKHMKGSFAND